MNEFRQLLEAGDVTALRRAWHRAAPHLPQPASFAEAEVTMHYARTVTESISLGLRRYSHMWLRERGHPSGLPETLEPPKIAEAVGISVNYSSPMLKPLANMLEKAMSDAVEDCFANGDKDPELVSAQMRHARRRTEKVLLGKVLSRE